MSIPVPGREVDRMLAEGNHIMYSVLRKGTVVPAGMEDHGGSNHVCTWRIAYQIEGIREWLFRQTRPAA
jgi:predicted peptidase